MSKADVKRMQEVMQAEINGLSTQLRLIEQLLVKATTKSTFLSADTDS